jgi:hypothetical protein
MFMVGRFIHNSFYLFHAVILFSIISPYWFFITGHTFMPVVVAVIRNNAITELVSVDVFIPTFLLEKGNLIL